MDFILIDGDQVHFQPAFGAANVIIKAGKIKASGESSINKERVCVEGDETNVSVPGCMYSTPQYGIPGTGTIKIAQLSDDQIGKISKSGGKPVLLKGKYFKASFEVVNPAKQPPPGAGSPIPDATPSYAGQGIFISRNNTVKGS